jgi:hypothetical protein
MMYVARIPHPPSPHTVIVILLLSSMMSFAAYAVAVAIAIRVAKLPKKCPRESQCPDMSLIQYRLATNSNVVTGDGVQYPRKTEQQGKRRVFRVAKVQSRQQPES